MMRIIRSFLAIQKKKIHTLIEKNPKSNSIFYKSDEIQKDGSKKCLEDEIIEIEDYISFENKEIILNEIYENTSFSILEIKENILPIIAKNKFEIEKRQNNTQNFLN